MTTQDLTDLLYPAAGDKILTQDQQNILHHKNGPAWILAGPGSGKTEILTLMVLRLLYVSNDPVQKEQVPPESIFVTTFTKKAARNLEDRISRYSKDIQNRFPETKAINLSRLRIGTLHSLCQDILLDQRAPQYQNVRMMDEFEQELFIHESLDLFKNTPPSRQLTFWRRFSWMFRPNQWQPIYEYPPSKWKSARAIKTLLDRIVENRVDTKQLKGEDDQCKLLTDIYQDYVQKMKESFRCDFPHLQSRFLDYLLSEPVNNLVTGVPENKDLGIKWVLVDEYQDTNPMQEEIYFTLAKRSPHNLVVVGDDDQAMYRFRGGSVECMVTFDKACEAFLNLKSQNVKKYPLVDNFRSHPQIVDFFDDYINTFPIMGLDGVRASKPRIRAKSSISGNYPAVSRIAGKNVAEMNRKFVSLIQSLLENEVINDLSDCCLLLTSTRDSPNNAGKFIKSLSDAGINVYNPRNKAFTRQDEVQLLLGALLRLFDPRQRFMFDQNNSTVVSDKINKLSEDFDSVINQYEELSQYIRASTHAIESQCGEPLKVSLQELAYLLMSLEPFTTWQKDPVKRKRLGKITSLLEVYSSMPILDRETGRPKVILAGKNRAVEIKLTRGYIKTSDEFPGEVDSWWLRGFCHLFLGAVLNTGIDDFEDEDVIVPQGMLPIMTMHQAKGLEFPFVFVGHLNGKATPSSTHEIEELFSRYPIHSSRKIALSDSETRANTDVIRQFYVAYSRAKHALILVGLQKHFNEQSVPLGSERRWVKNRTVSI